MSTRNQIGNETFVYFSEFTSQKVLDSFPVTIVVPLPSFLAGVAL